MNYRIPFIVALGLIVIGLCGGLFAIQKLGGWRYTAHRLHTLEAWPTYTQRVSQLNLLPIDSGAITFLGDSHMAYGEWSEWLPSASIANRGIPGEGIVGLKAFAKTQQLEESSAVFVQIGTNDLLFHEAEEVVAMYQRMIDEFSMLSIPVFYCTLPGVNNQVRWTGIDPDDVALINTFIRAQTEKGQQVLDLAEVLNTNSGILPIGLTDDGVHLRGKGYSLWATEIFYHLNRVVAHD